MTKILIATHSTMAQGIVNSCKFLVGNVKDIRYIDAYVDDSDWTKEVDEFFSDFDNKESYVVFTDIYGGSVNQKITQYKAKYDFLLVTGVNLPIVLQCVLSTNPITKDRILKMIDEAKNSLSLVELQESSENNEEDFLE
ncbi:PTS fructose transporter subunit IIA [Lactobacillus sp. ESL0791]|uniref:PTS sugar transporter subunit IIA n=1 Tax=Lactobacillus sp. ESL0791 TaxID=2983234 RepID=UPI0023F914D1|nr:PTS fructose transporter subunit IIA [Lactobacillus sp. ESL0791]MDF7638083.1 PTS fructose transporter subunit IIA [Lactobacillus sp. ESL0791]